MPLTKQLLIIRHAKSDWDNNLSDFDRPLNKRGEKNAPEMAQRLIKKHIIPQHIISSPAKRAITTADYFADILKINKKDIQKENNIYEASVSDLMKVIGNLDNSWDLVALFGHNPGLTNLAQNLCDAAIYDIPTCGMVLIKFSFDDWRLISSGTGALEFFDYPKNED